MGRLVTPKQVRARIAKRERRCPGVVVAEVIAGSASAKVTEKCPGWRLRETKQRKVRVVACEECNALQPERLRVTDEMVRSLDEATTAATYRELQLDREHEASITTAHYYADTTTGMSILCGRTEFGYTRSRRARHVRKYNLERVTCAECLRLAEMTEEEREAERAARSAELKAKFSGKQSEAKQQREWALLATRLLVEESRLDAMVLLDAWEADSTTLSWTQEQRDQLSVALDVAVDARCAETSRPRGRGRLWVMRDMDKRTREGNAHCRFCEALIAEGINQGSSLMWQSDPSSGDHDLTQCALRYLAGKHAPQVRTTDEVSPSSNTVSGSQLDEDGNSADACADSLARHEVEA